MLRFEHKYDTITTQPKSLTYGLCAKVNLAERVSIPLSCNVVLKKTYGLCKLTTT